MRLAAFPYARLPSAILLLAAAAPPALAQTCTITPASGSYGVVDVLAGSAVDSSSTFTVSCSGLSGFTVRLCLEMGPGNNYDASGNRVLISGANTLRHDFYTSAARNVLWGSWGYSLTAYAPYPIGIQSDLALGLLGNASRSFTVYSRVLAGQQTAVPGSYTWHANASPGMSYGYAGGSACPTGSRAANSGGSDWTATINPSCNLSTGNLNFGSKGLLTSNTDATNSLGVTCTNTTPYSVGLNGGTSGAADPTKRKMTAGAASVTYGIYRDAARSLPWGSTIGTNTASGTGSGVATAFTGYGRVPVQVTPAPGTYTDTVVMTVTY
jgi:spore coat protein U-like protein